MASSGSIMNATKTIFKHEEMGGLHLSLLNASGAKLNVGQEVNLKVGTNLSVEKRTLGTKFPIGVVTVGEEDGALVTVHTVCQRTIAAIAKGGTLAVGDFVKPNGTYNALGIPEYVASAINDYIGAVVLSGGVVDAEVVVGVLRAPFQRVN